MQFDRTSDPSRSSLTHNTTRKNSYWLRMLFAVYSY